jgi:hypothetical protein
MLFSTAVRWLVRDRFTPEMLDGYLRNFGIECFSADLFDVPQPALRISNTGACPAALKSYSLEEVQSGSGYTAGFGDTPSISGSEPT